QTLQDPAYARAAKKAADFILGQMVKDGRLMRRFRHGHIAHPGFLDDYAFFIWGLLELYEATFEFVYLAEASRLNQIVIELFWDEKQGGFFYTGKDSEPLITRMKDLYDGAIPSGNSVAALNLLRLSRLTGNVGLEEMADRMLRTFAASMGEYPMAYTQFLNFLDFVVGPSREIVICGDPQEQDGQAIISWIQQKFLPNKVMLLKPTGPGGAGPGGKDILNLAPFTKEMQPIQGKTAVYICSAYACQKPVTELEDLAKILP
ncbi:MAG: thioredoxin domain-containing protein, partial [Deltaproteobacteria bacterium]|nr:thioredoxin domain-containing protein [Deltaproteobacteria bacterium]